MRLRIVDDQGYRQRQPERGIAGIDMRLDDRAGNSAATQISMQPQRVPKQGAHPTTRQRDQCDTGGASSIKEEGTVILVATELVDSIDVVQRDGDTILAESDRLSGPVSQKRVAQHGHVRRVCGSTGAYQLARATG